MRSWIKDDQVRRHIQQGRELPARFDDFVRAQPPFRLEWNDLGDYGLKPTATEEAVPFLRLPDGALVALWYDAASPVVVHIGAHGELEVIARDFDDFLRGINGKCSGIPDFDEGEENFSVPGVTGKPKKTGLSALQKRFKQWFKTHTSLVEPLEGPDAESLRRRVFRIAKQMIGDGHSKVHKLSSVWWDMDFKIERRRAGLSITYLDFGEWYAVPAKYALEEEVSALLTLIRNKDRFRYELSVCSPGIVSIDDDRELVLVPLKKRGKK